MFNESCRNFSYFSWSDSVLKLATSRESGRGGSGLDLPSSGSSTANIQAFLIPAPDSVKDELKKFLELSYS